MRNGFLTWEEMKQIGFKHIGKDVRISRLASFYYPEKISLGDFCRIDDFNVISGAGSVIIGNYVHIANHGTIIAPEKLILEDFSGVSSGVRIYTASDDFSGGSMAHPTIPEIYRNVKYSPVRLCRHTIIGANSVILPGVTLEEGAAVGACSLVTKSLPAWGIYGGVPAKLIKPRKKDLLNLEQKLLKENK